MDATHLERAVELAQQAQPHPNPRVGAVVVDTAGQVVGEGMHRGPGSPHAEAVALEVAGNRAAGGTLYVTLEPCNHQGRTPPCTDAIIEAGIRRVVAAAEDPDVQVSGRGFDRLRAAGIEVVVGVPGVDGEAVDPGYFIHRRLGRPRVTLKMAATFDGQTAAADGSSQWITGEASREDAHRLRSESDAVMVGIGTVIADDPRLDVRLVETARQPRPIVVEGKREVPADAAILQRDPLILSPREGGGRIAVPDGSSVDLRSGLQELGSRGIVDLLVEGGPGLAASLWSAGLVDRLVVYLAGKIAGGIGKGMFTDVFATIGQATPVKIAGEERLGSDLRIEMEV